MIMILINQQSKRISYLIIQNELIIKPEKKVMSLNCNVYIQT